MYIIHHQLFLAGCNVHLAQSCPGLFLYFSCSNRKFSLVISPQLAGEVTDSHHLQTLSSNLTSEQLRNVIFSPSLEADF